MFCGYKCLATPEDKNDLKALGVILFYKVNALREQTPCGIQAYCSDGTDG